MYAVRMAEVSKRYGRRWALSRVTVDLPASRAVLLTGPNGAGKTTLLRILATTLTPTHGSLELLGLDARLHRDSIRAKVALATHTNHLYDALSAVENLELLARFAGVERRRVSDVLERVGLMSRGRSPVHTLSAGMKRRLALARVLLREPELVLLDEPFTQLDPEGVRLAEEIIRELRQRWVTLVLATHDVERGRALCELHLHMRDGRLSEPPVALARAGADA